MHLGNAVTCVLKSSIIREDLEWVNNAVRDMPELPK